MSLRCVLASESSFVIYFGEGIDPEVSKAVQNAYHALKEAKKKGFFELIPSYASLMVCYDVLAYSYEEAKAIALEVIAHAKVHEEGTQKTITLPVYYGAEVGLDLLSLSEEKGLSVEEIIALHVSQTYSVYAIGFAPGFAYMGQIDARLETARLSSPRKSIPAGSVAIADRQSAIYPLKGPGGWKILGQTPLKMFDERYEGLSRLHVGDSVCFEAISQSEFLRLGGVL